MKPCDENRLRIALYLDDELRDEELAAFETHLAACAACQAAVDAERRFLDDLHSARPQYGSSPRLRKRVENILRDMPGEMGQEHSRANFSEFFGRIISALPGWHSPRLQAAGALGLAVLTLGGLWFGRMATSRSDSHSEFAAMAVRVHKARVKGKLTLAMESQSPAAITDWVNARAAFKVHLPSYDETPSESQPYRYEGATLVSYHNASAAYINYETGGTPVSLVALPTSLTPPLRGKGVKMKSLTVYYDTVDNYHVITWSGPKTRMTYALVSDLAHPSQACIICHASSSPKDRDLMASLRTQ